ncbi:MAG: potassium-transporting ATPase subunit C, partial [Dermabacter sp.]|nr:potassium-transporting ATPase subunit C [Dermabacter sp.]
AKNSGLSRSAVAQLVKKHTQGRTLGFAGEEVVNVNDLNLDLRAAKD